MNDSSDTNELHDSKVSDQLKIYFEYTKFHIGLYISLIVGVLAYLKFGIGNTPPSQPPHLLVLAIVAWGVAGACGAVIAHNIPDFQTVRDIRAVRIGPYWTKLLPGKQWEIIEHGSFWIGAFLAMIHFVKLFW